MTRIAHLADLHLGYSQFGYTTSGGQNQREADFQRAALACIDHIVEDTKPDLVVVAGDTLHDTRVSNIALDGAIELFARLEDAGIPAVVIGGNHDEAASEGRFNALHILRRHGVRLFLEQDELDIAGVRLHFMPFQVLARALRGRTELRPFQFSTDLPNVLIGHAHAAAPGMPTPPEEVTLPVDWLEDPRFSLVCLGHIHRHFKVEGYDRVFYAGSVERRDFGERHERPGFWVHEVAPNGDLTSESVFVEELGVPLTPRPMLQHEVEARELSTDILNEKVLNLIENPAVEGAMVRVVITNVSAELDRSRARAQWKRAFRKAGGFHLDTASQTRRVLELLDVKFAAPPVNIAEAFQEFLSAQQFDSDSEREMALALGAEVMATAHDKLLSQEAD